MAQRPHSLIFFDVCMVQNYTYTPNKALADELDNCDPTYSACSSSKKRSLAEEANILVKSNSAVKSRSSAKRVRITTTCGHDDDEEGGDVYTEDLYAIADSADAAVVNASNQKPSAGMDADGASSKPGSESESEKNGSDSQLATSRAFCEEMAPNISPERCVLQFGDEEFKQSEHADDDVVVKPATTNLALQKLQQRLACVVAGSEVQISEKSAREESDAVEGTPLRRSTRIRNTEVCVCVLGLYACLRCACVGSLLGLETADVCVCVYWDCMHV
jgi:hypothetical protein